MWLVSKTVSDKLRAHLLSQGVSGIPEKNTAIFDILQEHAIVQLTSDGKAIWNATVTSETGWSHSFTFLKVSPALIWQGANRPDCFKGDIVVNTPEHTIAASSSVKQSIDNTYTQQEQAVSTGLDSIFDLLDIDCQDEVKEMK